MAKAKPLPSGSWHCLVYSHTEKISQSDGSIKNVRKYHSITCDIPGEIGRAACGKEAAEWKKNNLERQKAQKEGKEAKHPEREAMTFGQALDRYIENRFGVLSPSTVREYKRSRKKGFRHSGKY